jgi:hypothetical protein
MVNNFFSQNRAVWELMWNIAEPDRPQQTIWRMRIACWMNKTTATHSEFVILIACPRQQQLNERPSMLRYTRIARLVSSPQNPDLPPTIWAISPQTKWPKCGADQAPLSRLYGCVI